MCCLFGLIDYRHGLSVKQKNKFLSVLATVCEARGTDATGIAYNSGGKLRVYKRPVPGHWMRFRIPADAWAIMGHTRMATQGSARKNYNNHPFFGKTGHEAFALAHNGVLYNDCSLRRSLSLPCVKIETDSYIGVQLIEQKKALDFTSLRYMAEQVEGSFTFTVLDGRDNFYFIKGDNPVCLYHFPTLGMYLYTSTEEIMRSALSRLHLPDRQAYQIGLTCGEILKIDCAGKMTRSWFDDSNLIFTHYNRMCLYPYGGQRKADGGKTAEADSHMDEIKVVASAFGYTPEAIDRLADMGFSAEEVEEFLYCGEM